MDPRLPALLLNRIGSDANLRQCREWLEATRSAVENDSHKARLLESVCKAVFGPPKTLSPVQK